MNKDFIDALNQLATERNIDKDQLLSSFEEALEQAYERNVEPGRIVEVQVDPDSGEIDVLVIRRVVETLEEPDQEILLSEALELDPGVDERVGDAQVAAAHDAEHDVRPRARQCLPDRLRDPRHGA